MGATRTAFVVVAGLALVPLSQGPAAAHYVYEKHWTYQSDEMCVYTRAEVSHGDGAGYARTDTTALANWGGVADCESRAPQPAGWIGAQPNFLVYFGRGGNNGWYLCKQYGNYWEYNARKVSQFATSLAPIADGPPCGDRHYGNLAYSRVWFNSAWLQGGLWSGSHYLVRR